MLILLFLIQTATQGLAADHQTLVSPINVTAFGAVGDGRADDTQAVEQALTAATATGGELFFPPGTYRLTSGTKIEGRGRALRITGTGATIHLDGLAVAWTFRGRFQSLAIDHLRFTCARPQPTPSNNHLSGAIACIPFQQSIEGLVIEDCLFSGFGNAIRLTGCTRPVVRRCTFEAPYGRDACSTNFDVPAGHVWFQNDAATGRVIDPIISDCWFTGYSGTAGLAVDAPLTNCPMDNAVVFTHAGEAGFCGLSLRNCHSRNFAFEHYILGSTDDATLAVPPWAIFEGNHLDMALPSGSKGRNGAALRTVAGIRCDVQQTRIAGNTIVNACAAISCQTYFGPHHVQRQVQILGNTIMAQPDLTTPVIALNGRADMPLAEAVITGNVIDTAGGFVVLARISRLRMSGNHFRGTRDGALSIQHVPDVAIIGNTFAGYVAMLGLGDRCVGYDRDNALGGARRFNAASRQENWGDGTEEHTVDLSLIPKAAPVSVATLATIAAQDGAQAEQFSLLCRDGQHPAVLATVAVLRVPPATPTWHLVAVTPDPEGLLSRIVLSIDSNRLLAANAGEVPLRVALKPLAHLP